MSIKPDVLWLGAELAVAKARIEKLEAALLRLRESDGPILYLMRLAIIEEALGK